MMPWAGIPNLITLLRIGLIPVFIVCFYLPFSYAHIVAAIIFTLASLTDWLDGFLARKLRQVSPFGAFLDPVADKLLVASSLLMLVGSKNMHYIVIPAIIIVGREIVISALREWMAEIGSRTSVAVGYIGKVKTSLQMLAIILLLAFNPHTSLFGMIGLIMLYLASIMTVWSMIVYLRVAWPELIKN
ncbi:MAG: CDP-diacylglycerol--glycerol-3-phosphate 3-phosphatidyltransferase [Legionellaceae bacterium]|nr:CDP-diacylglycerol--glycerol-3-phosphate 3-phosphatidyltransferase [Legionellaceae bacterium]